MLVIRQPNGYSMAQIWRANRRPNELGHGFVPRIHAGNYRPVDRSLEPPTLDGSHLDLPWAIVEAPWALKRPPLLEHLRHYGTQILVDTQA